jgi:hypothetical protein
MNGIERRVLQLADSDWTWVGFNWLRPAKEQRVGYAYLCLSSLLLGLPGLGLGAALLLIVFGSIDPRVWLGMVGLVLTVEFVLHCLFAVCWNRRVQRLATGAE